MEDSRDQEDIEIDICDRDSDTESRKDGDEMNSQTIECSGFLRTYSDFFAVITFV